MDRAKVVTILIALALAGTGVSVVVNYFDDEAAAAQIAAEVGVLHQRVFRKAARAIEGVAAHEQLDPLAFLQRLDAGRDARQLLDRRLEQLVAGEGLQGVEKRLAAVTRRRQP